MVHIDNSGPLLAVDVNDNMSQSLLVSMHNGTIPSPFPKFTAKELDAFGIIQGIFIYSSS